jgi:hypothetical protein
MELLTLGPQVTPLACHCSDCAILSIHPFSQIQGKWLVELEATVNSSWRDSGDQG